MLVGCGSHDITPQLPVATLYNHPSRADLTEHVADPLAVRCAVFRSRERMIAVVAYDLLAMSRGLADAIKADLTPLGLSPADVLLSCTHSHTTPLLVSFRDRYPADEAHARLLRERTRAAVVEALAGAKECALGVGAGRFEGAINRREQGRLADINDLTAPSGTIDPEVGVLVARSERALGVIVSFACHPLTMSAGDAISADFPGALVQAIETAEPGACALFLQGAGANVNPKLHGGRAARDRIGGMLADEALRVLRETELRPSDDLASALRTVELPCDLPAAFDAARRIRERTDRGETVAGRDAGWAEDLLAAERSGALPEALTVPVQVLRIGPALIVALPGEPFVQIGLAMKRAVAEALPEAGLRVLVAGYANATDCGYIPAPDVTRFGDYETVSAPRYYPCLLGPTAAAAEVLARAAAQMAAEMLG